MSGSNRYPIGSAEDQVHHPLWSVDGTRLIYFAGGRDKALSVPIRTTPSVAFGRPEPLPGAGLPLNVQPDSLRNHDAAPDGRFITIVTGAGEVRPEIVVVQNWFEELKRLVPVK